MKKKIVKTDNAPAAVGPYSQAVEISGDKILFVSGQLPMDPVSNEIKKNIKNQTEQSLKNIKEILKTAEYSMDNIVKTTVYLNDMGNFSSMNEVYKSFFNDDFPARCAVEVAELPKNVEVEIEAVAVK